jgi:hypothetical protein
MDDAHNTPGVTVFLVGKIKLMGRYGTVLDVYSSEVASGGMGYNVTLNRT